VHERGYPLIDKLGILAILARPSSLLPLGDRPTLVSRSLALLVSTPATSSLMKFMIISAYTLAFRSRLSVGRGA